MMRSRRRVGALLAAMAVLATACASNDDGTDNGAAEVETEASPDEAMDDDAGSDDGDAVSASTVTLGWSGPFTGPLQAMAQTMESGLLIATDDLNAGGGEECPELDWVVKDDALSPDTAVAQAQEFLSEEIDIMVGPAVNTPFLPTRQYYADEGVPQFLVGTAAEGVDLEAFPHVYRTFFSGDDEAELLIEYLNEQLGAEEIAILVENTGSGLPGQQSFERAIEANDAVTLVSNQVFPGGEENLSPHIEEIRDSGADAIALWSVGPPNTANVIKAMDEVGLDIPIAGDIGALFKGTPALAGESLPQVDLYAGAWKSELYSEGSEPIPAAVEVRDAVKERMGVDEMIDSVHLAIMYFNTTHVIHEALCRSGGDPSADALKAALYEAPIETPTGDVYEFSADNHDGYVKENLSVAHITLDSWQDGFWQKADGAP